MTPPRYHPTCNYRACRNQTTGETATATTYVVGKGAETLFVCGPCARKMAIALGLEEDPKKKKLKTRRKARAVA